MKIPDGDREGARVATSAYGSAMPRPTGRSTTGRSIPVSERQSCLEGGSVHAWDSTGLDVDALGVLMTTRRCVWCGTEQHKAYGAGGRKPWHSPAKAKA